jgi:hypothetical protein
LLAVVLATVVGGCSLAPPATPAPTPDDTMIVSRRPGTVTVSINGVRIGTLACGETRGLVVGTDLVPPFPWLVELGGPDGGSAGSVSVKYPPPMLLVTPDGVGASLTEGPTFDPATQCGP